jgi:branched-chain amino acid transport system ATP-binding protein
MPTSDVPVLELHAVSAGYGDVRIIHDVSLSIPAGHVVGIGGANGAGKTTLLKTISRLTRLYQGEIRIDGRDVSRARPAAVSRLGVGHVPEGRRVFRGMSVRENLLVGGHTAGADLGTRLDGVLEIFPRLRERMAQRAETLSGGEQQMLAIGRTLMMQPRLIMLDEPSQGLSPAMVDVVVEGIRAITRSGATVLIVEQNISVLAGLADTALTISHGTVASMPVGELRSRDLLSTLLGVE